ncbi:MAG TPA: hypothetical protein DCK95_04040 [Anaerolineaceae bacterium]|nr:hypothetical protein [Anaerolineaceae bacterium]
MKKRAAKIISTITLAPFVSFYLLTAIYIRMRSVFEGVNWYVACLFFLTLMPISAYGLQYLIPSIRRQGRRGERRLAFIMSVAGYILGTLSCFLFNAPSGVKLIFLAYLVSGGVLALTNSVVGLKASGHACGIAGPYVLAIYFFGRHLWYLLLLLLPVYWARLTMKQHSLKELNTGTLVGLAATSAVVIAF